MITQRNKNNVIFHRPIQQCSTIWNNKELSVPWMAVCSLRGKCSMLPARLFISQVVLHLSPGVLSKCSLLSVLNCIRCTMSVVGDNGQFRSPRGTCKLKPNSRLYHIDLLLSLCVPAGSLYYFTWLHQTNFLFPLSKKNTSLLELKWPLRNVCKLSASIS